MRVAKATASTISWKPRGIESSARPHVPRAATWSNRRCLGAMPWRWRANLGHVGREDRATRPARDRPLADSVARARIASVIRARGTRSALRAGMLTANVRTLCSLVFLSMAAACGGSGATVGSLDAGNPPDCPATSPSSGAPCNLAAGARCDYGCSDGGPSIATCTGSVWSVAVLEIACIAPSDAGSDAAPPPANAPFACGKETCGVTQYCEQPCCGGVAPPCEAMPDSGACEQGWHSASCTAPGAFVSGNNCQEDPCVPPPPTCIDDPSSEVWCTPSPASSRYLSCVCG